MFSTPKIVSKTRDPWRAPPREMALIFGGLRSRKPLCPCPGARLLDPKGASRLSPSRVREQGPSHGGSLVFFKESRVILMRLILHKTNTLEDFLTDILSVTHELQWFSIDEHLNFRFHLHTYSRCTNFVKSRTTRSSLCCYSKTTVLAISTSSLTIKYKQQLYKGIATSVICV